VVSSAANPVSEHEERTCVLHRFSLTAFLFIVMSGVTMSSFAKVSAVAFAVSAGLLFTAGCETGRTNKQHEHYAISDESTTGKQDAAFAGATGGQPPVPGSPTAAGADGKQPYDDLQARAGEGAEEGMSPPPATQPKDAFQRQ
jgi:hypothetical protein